MSEIRNLTRNGETFYPLTIAEAVYDSSGNYIGNYVSNPEWIRVICDSEGKILAGIKANGEVEWSLGVPTPIKEYIQDILDNYSTTSEIQEALSNIQTALSGKVDKEEGKSLSTNDYTDTDKEIVNVSSLTNDSEFLEVTTDNEGKILEVIQKDGTKVISGDTQVGGSTTISGDATILGKVDIQGVTYTLMQNEEWIRVIIDAQDHILCGIKTDGSIYLNSLTEIPSIIQDAINVVSADAASLAERISAIESVFSIVDNPEYIAIETDSEGKVLSGRNIDGSKFENLPTEFKDKVSIDGNIIENIQDIEGRKEIKTDSEGRVLSYRNSEGVLHENAGIKTNSLSFSGNGLSAFEKLLKDDGFTPGGGGDYTDTITEKGKKPVYIPTPRLARVNIIWDGNLSNLSKSDRPDGVQKVNYDVKVPVEFFDGQGVYFKKYALMSAQGNSSMAFIKKNISLKFFDTEDVEGKKKKWGKGDTFGTVFGDWVMQKTYHLKAFHTDFIRGSSEVAYQLADEVYKTRGVYADRPWKKALIDFSEITSVTPANLSKDGSKDMNLQIDNGARCMPDGFPVIVYQNGEFYGIYVWMLKKDADNFNMDTEEVKHIHIDGTLYVENLWGGNINWTAFEIRNPEDLVCMDGSDYDGDFPAELIDSTSKHYNSTDENHVRSAQVKQYIIDLSTRVGQINALTPTYTRPDEVVITLNDYKGAHNIDNSYSRGNWVLDPQSSGAYYMSLHAIDGTAETKHPLTDTDYWLDISAEIAQIKSAIETYFDVDNLVDYQLINMACGDSDGFGKNWQWTTWDGVKWYVNQYDKDMSFGNMWTGMFTTAPKTGWINSNINLPNGLAIRYYTPEYKVRWQELVSAGIFNAEHIKSLITTWISRIGKDNFTQEWKAWPEAPCNRSSKIDFEYWKFTGGSINGTPTSGTIWDDATSYSVGDVVWFKAFDGNWHLQFKAVKAGSNHSCLKDSYSVYPMSMGYRDSVWRFYKYIEKTIENQNTFINTLN